MKFKKTVSILTALLIMSSFALPVCADWETDRNGTYYTDDSGKKVTGLEEIDGETYYFDRKGVMQTGWQTIRRKYTAYFRKNGAMVKGKAKINGKLYYFNEKGYLVTGYAIIDGKIYDCGNDGIISSPLKNTLVDIDGRLYYAGANGTPASGLCKTADGNYFYFGSKGYSVSTTVTQDGYTYELDKKLGLISKKEAPADASKINVKVDAYSDAATDLNSFRCHNNTDGTKFFYSGWIKNTAAHNGCSVRVDMELYDKDGELISTEKMVTTPILKVSDEYKFDSYVSVDEPVYKIKFKVTRIR